MKNHIELNGKIFAKNKSGLVDTLFKPTANGNTADGYYTKTKNVINFYEGNGLKIAVISNNVLGCATKQKCGEYWYSYATPRMIGDFPSYTCKQKAIQNAIKIANI